MNELILILAMAAVGSTGQTNLAPPPNIFTNAGSFQAHWKSIITGAEWEMRKDHDVLYLERLLSDTALREDHLTSLELHKGKKGYRGRERQVVGGAYTDGSGREVSYRCVFDWPAELAVLSESRVEIRVWSPPDNARIDFRKCAVEKTRVWHTAVWIPE